MAKYRLEPSGKFYQSGPNRLDKLSGVIGKPAMKKYGFHELHLFQNWPEIVGQELAQDCIPSKLTRGRHKQGAALAVRVEGYRALEFQHLAPQIIDRINQFLGANVVTHLRITQGPVNRMPVAVHKNLPELNDEERSDLGKSVKSIENKDLQASLRKLGEQIMRSTKGQQANH